jgi:uncharacterized protein (DUF58 family)
LRRARELALAGALLCATAALLATPALYVPGLAAIVAAVVAPLWVISSASRVHVSVSVEATIVREGERVPMTVLVRRGRLPPPGATLLTWPGCREVTATRRSRERLELSVLALRRGRQPVGPIRLRVADPLGICSREVLSNTPDLLVLPRVFAIGAAALAKLEGTGARTLRGAPEIDALRPHVAGTPAARIHWPTVARTGALMERVLAGVHEPGVLVVLDARRAESDESLDSAVRAAASLCVHLVRRGGCRVLLPGEQRATALGADARAQLALLRRLALVESQTIAGADGRLPGVAGTVLYVTAARGDHGPPLGRGYRIGPHPLASAPVSFTVAGCAAQTIGSGAWARSA